VNPAAVGIVTGFATDPAGVTYANISHGIYFASGAYTIIEQGVEITPATSFAASDEFVIARAPSGQVVYSRNGTRDYTSTLLSEGVVYVDASLYFGGDEITDAAIEAYATPSGGSGTGTHDPAPPATPPPGYGPGSGPVPPPPPGTTLRYSVCNGSIGPFNCWASTTTPNGVQPGPGPRDSEPPDANGDWPGRIGGVLRMFVGRAEGQGYGNWNGGSVGEPGSGTTPTDPGGGSPVDPHTGDWSGRMGGAWPMFVGEAYGSAGAGEDYAICAGTLGGFVADAGANLLTPQFAILAGVLQPFQSWSTTLVGQVGTLAGWLTPFTTFSATIDGGWVDGGGAPPFVPPTTIPGTGGGGGSTDIFRETFTGAGGAMTGDTPDTGGAAWTGDTAELVRDGSGNLVVDAGETFGEIVSVIDPISDPVGLTTTIDFTVGASGSAPSYIDFALTDAGGTNWWVDTFLHTSDGVTWMLSPSTPSDFTDVDVTALITPGAHTITTVVTDTEILFYIDDVLVPDATLPLPTLTTDIEEVHVTLQQNVGAPTVSIDEVSITLGTPEDIPVGGSEPDEFGDWPGRMGGVWRQFVCHAYTLDAFAAGGGFEATHGGHYRLLAQGYSPSVINDPVTGFPVGYGFYGLHGGEYLLDAWGGGLFSIEGPHGTLEAEGLASILGGFVATGPSGVLEITGLAGIAGSFAGKHFGKWTLNAYGGGVFNVTGPHGTLGSSTGSGSAGGGIGMAFGGFSATGPHGQLVATGYSVGLGTFDVIGPALQPVWGDLISVGPHGYLEAAGNPWLTPGSAVPVGGSEGYSITLMETGDGLTTATSRLTQYPFERIVRFGSTYFGITPAGIYQLGGDTFAGVPIVAVITHPPHDFSGALGRSAERAQQKIKTMRSIMLTGHVPASVQVTVAVDDDLTSSGAYSYTPEPTDTARNHRIEVGRGLEGRYIAMSLTNPNGEDFTLEETSAEFDVSKQRNVWRT